VWANRVAAGRVFRPVAAQSQPGRWFRALRRPYPALWYGAAALFVLDVVQTVIGHPITDHGQDRLITVHIPVALLIFGTAVWLFAARVPAHKRRDFRPPAAEPWRDRRRDAASRPLHRAVLPPGREERMKTRPLPSAARPARPSLPLAIGDVVVYASHGIGRVESTHDAAGTEPAKIIFLLESGLRVTLPLARAREALRSVSGEPELETVRLTLRSDVGPQVGPWSRRRRFAEEKLAAGEIGGLAEIVRDGLERERRLTTSSSKPIANELFRQARKLLAAEIAASRGIEPEEADAWILQQVVADCA
jgi:RNA polymerase-interacting CarD/CdnL/TRCF family regulator